MVRSAGLPFCFDDKMKTENQKYYSSIKIEFFLLTTLIGTFNQMTLQKKDDALQTSKGIEGISLPWTYKVCLSWRLDVFLLSIEGESVMRVKVSFWFLCWNLTLEVSVIIEVTPCLFLGCRRPVWCLFESRKFDVLQANYAYVCFLLA